MSALDSLEIVFVVNAFLFQIILIVHFAVRKWRFETAIRFGPLVYALSVPAAVVSTLLLLGGKPWYLWLGGVLYLAWAVFGYVVEYVLKKEWRSPVYWPILGPYLTLYLAAVMFYWFPLARLWKPLWVGYAVLFVISTILNLSSHAAPRPAAPAGSILQHH